MCEVAQAGKWALDESQHNLMVQAGSAFLCDLASQKLQTTRPCMAGMPGILGDCRGSLPVRVAGREFPPDRGR